MAGTRTDIAKLGGVWSDTMIWYARAVGELRTRSFNQRTSWTYFAAIHGITPQAWLDQGILPPGTPAPSQNEFRLMFNQCQHAGWFFLPWHRGYLHAFESVLASWIESQGGPSDWALPYWNYLNASDPNARKIPPEFLDPKIKGGDPNPLSQATRGPATTLGPQTWVPVDITLDAQTSETVYTSEPGALGYGGPISGFAQQGNAYGANESDPHNLVHVMVGGDNTPSPQGWMYDPNFAALDPIFWLHHCNIDRLWAAWMTDASHTKEDSVPWRNGPFPRQFTMPDASSDLAIFVPSDALPSGNLAPVYDDLADGTGIPPLVPGGPAMVAATTTPANRTTLIGVNSERLVVSGTPVHSNLAMTIPAPLVAAAVGKKRVFLNAEGVKGDAPSGVLNVILTAPGVDPANAGSGDTKTLVFFGLANATSVDGPHGGSGLSQTVDITSIANRLLSGGQLDELVAHLQQPDGGAEITVDRISIYSRLEP
jgi:tyrosinase